MNPPRFITFNLGGDTIKKIKGDLVNDRFIKLTRK